MRNRLASLVRTFALVAFLSVVSAALAQPPSGEGGRGGPMPRGGMPGGPMGMGFGGGMGMGFGGAGGGSLFLLNNEAIQQELKLTKKQTAQIEKLLGSYQEDMQKQMQNSGFDPSQFGELSPEARAKKFEELRQKQEKAFRKLQNKYQPRMTKLLKKEQSTRLEQIGYQLAGTMALRNEDVVKALKLSKDQQGKIDEAFEAAGKQMREMFAGGPGGFGGGPFGGGGPQRRPDGNPPGPGGPRPGPGGNAQAPGGNNAGPGGNNAGPSGGGQPPAIDPEVAKAFQERFEKMRKLNEERDAQLLAVLSDEQKQQFEELKGEPFDLAKMRPRGFGPPGQGPGEGQRGKGPGGRREKE